MSSSSSSIHCDQITEGVFNPDLWDRLDLHFGSYVKSPLQLRFISTKTTLLGRAVRHAIVDLLDHIPEKSTEHIEDNTTVIGTEHRLYHSGHYRLHMIDEDNQFAEMKDPNDEIRLEIQSLAPTVFHRLREDIGLTRDQFRQSFSEHSLKDFTNPGKSGSLMYKSSDDLFILKTLRAYEARLLMQILSGYHLQLTQRSTLFNRYIGLYSIRLPTLISSIEIYLVIMINAFTPSLRINEVFDLKGSTIKRQLSGALSMDNLHKLKDLDFLSLYPLGIRLPTAIYQRLKRVLINDAKVLKKLNITDFSLILGIRHLDTSEMELMQSRPASGVAALCHMSSSIALKHLVDSLLPSSPTATTDEEQSKEIYSLLKPLAMLDQPVEDTFYYSEDSIARSTRPIPGIINRTNQRVYLYLALVDMLQTFDSVKYLDQTFRKLTDYSRRFQYSVIEPDEYETRFVQFLLEKVFTDAGDDFPWKKTIVEDNEIVEYRF